MQLFTDTAFLGLFTTYIHIPMRMFIFVLFLITKDWNKMLNNNLKGTGSRCVYSTLLKWNSH